MTEKVNYCNQCPSSLRGMCCWFSIYDGVDNFIVRPCPYLSKKTRRCTIYKKRFEINPRCLTLKKGLERGAFPKECAYVKEYKGKSELPCKTVNNKKRNELIKIWKSKEKISLSSES